MHPFLRAGPRRPPIHTGRPSYLCDDWPHRHLRGRATQTGLSPPGNLVYFLGDRLYSCDSCTVAGLGPSPGQAVDAVKLEGIT